VRRPLVVALVGVAVVVAVAVGREALVERLAATDLSERLAAFRAEDPPPENATPRAAVQLVEVARGLTHPLFVTQANDGSGRLFVVEQGGRVRTLRASGLDDEPFLDARSLLDNASGERGLLGLALAPDFATSGVVYIAHTAPGPAVEITRLRTDAERRHVDLATRQTVLAMADPASNHNGGMIAFGPAGKLWISTGDGGRGGDPWNNAQNLDSLLGKLLRIDVVSEPYSIPADNPFAGQSGARGEIWAYGLRNPWRFSFDRATGELWIGDVGQNRWEEIDVEDPAAGGGRNYGWRRREGRHCYDPKVACGADGLVDPIHEYGHDHGCSVTGGYVYRGAAIPELAGAYVFGDYCNGTVWSLRRESGQVDVAKLVAGPRGLSSFGEDAAGELYLCDHSGGRVLRLVPGEAPRVAGG